MIDLVHPTNCCSVLEDSSATRKRRQCRQTGQAWLHPFAGHDITTRRPGGIKRLERGAGS